MATTWSNTRGAEGFPFWAWGYIVDASGAPVPYPNIQVDGDQQVYGGDGGGVFNLAVRSGSAVLSVTDNVTKNAIPMVVTAEQITGQHAVLTPGVNAAPSSASGSSFNVKTLLLIAAGIGGIWYARKKKLI